MKTKELSDILPANQLHGSEPRTDLYRHVLDALPLFVYRVDLYGSVFYANNALLEMLDTPLEDLLGKTAYDFFPPEQAKIYLDNDQQVIDSHEPFHTVLESVQIGAKRRPYVEIIKTPVFGSNGDVVAIQGVFWDISKRALKQGQLLKNQILLKTLAEHAPDHVLLLDRHLRVVYINHAIAGVTVDDMVGASLPDFTPDYREYITEKLNVTLATGKMGVYETQYISPLGKRHYFETRALKLNEAPSGVCLHLTSTDITAAILYKQKLEQAAAVFTYAKEAVVIADENGKINNVNNAYLDITGLKSSQILGECFLRVFSDDVSPEKLAFITKAILEKGFFQGEYQLRNRKSTTTFAMAAISVIKSEEGKTQSYVLLLTDITRQKQHQAELEKIAHYDMLTNLPNRYLLDERLREAMEYASKHNEPLAIIYIDLDGFKAVNDNYGHQTGDMVLVSVARRMTNVIEVGDTVARLGGDEFIVVAPGIHKKANHSNLSHQQYFVRLLNSLVQPFHCSAGVFDISASLGITYYPQSDQVTPDRLIRQADMAMYEAKVHGKNRFVIFDTKKDLYQRDFGRIISELKHGMNNRELRLFYQPKVNMRSGELAGVEVLVRWQHPEKGLLLPEHFLPATVDDALSVIIDNWVIAESFTQLNQWCSDEHNFNLSINVSVKRLEERGFYEFLSTLFDEYPKIKQNCITFEILESSAVADLERVSSVIKEISQLGVKFSLDDFGTGFSTLSFLKKLSAEEVKIDRSFVHGMLEDESDLIIIRAVLGMAAPFGKRVVAEGVESEAHGLALLRLGCEYAQGYAIAKPMPPEQLTVWQKGWSPFQSWLNFKHY